MEKIVIGTHNPAKVTRYKKLLAQLVDEVLSLKDLGILEKAPECGNSAEENAENKAKFYARKSGLTVISEDEALYVDFLPKDKQPGVKVRRIEGLEEANDDELFKYWEGIVSKLPEEKRTGKWHFALSLAWPDGRVKTVTFDRPIKFFSPPSSKRIPGWPMSSLQGPPEFNKPHSELSTDEMEILNQEIDELISQKLQDFL